MNRFVFQIQILTLGPHTSEGCAHGNGFATLYYGTQNISTNELISVDGNFTGNAAFIQFIAQDPKIYGPGRVEPEIKPTPAPTKKPSGGVCFPGDAVCQIEGGGEILMKDIKLGDKVLVQGGKYEAVYSFGHRDEGTPTQYLNIGTAAGALVISNDHMVFTEGGRSVPASQVKVGDKLQLAEDGDLATVTDIHVVNKQGAYAPFTASGTVIVNGVKASSFIAFQDSECLLVAGVNTGLTFQFLAHTFERPHRFWCQYMSKCSEERYSDEGISLWVDIPHKAGVWFVNQNGAVMSVVVVPVLACVAFFAYPLSCLCVCLLLAAMLTPSRRLSLRVKAP